MGDLAKELGRFSIEVRRGLDELRVAQECLSNPGLLKYYWLLQGVVRINSIVSTPLSRPGSEPQHINQNSARYVKLVLETLRFMIATFPDEYSIQAELVTEKLSKILSDSTTLFSWISMPPDHDTGEAPQHPLLAPQELVELIDEYVSAVLMPIAQRLPPGERVLREGLTSGLKKLSLSHFPDPLMLREDEVMSNLRVRNWRKLARIQRKAREEWLQTKLRLIKDA